MSDAQNDEENDDDASSMLLTAWLLRNGFERRNQQGSVDVNRAEWIEPPGIADPASARGDMGLPQNSFFFLWKIQNFEKNS